MINLSDFKSVILFSSEEREKAPLDNNTKQMQTGYEVGSGGIPKRVSAVTYVTTLLPGEATLGLNWARCKGTGFWEVPGQWNWHVHPAFVQIEIGKIRKSLRGNSEGTLREIQHM